MSAKPGLEQSERGELGRLKPKPKCRRTSHVELRPLRFSHVSFFEFQTHSLAQNPDRRMIMHQTAVFFLCSLHGSLVYAPNLKFAFAQSNAGRAVALNTLRQRALGSQAFHMSILRRATVLDTLRRFANSGAAYVLLPTKRTVPTTFDALKICQGSQVRSTLLDQIYINTLGRPLRVIPLNFSCSCASSVYDEPDQRWPTS